MCAKRDVQKKPKQMKRDLYMKHINMNSSTSERIGIFPSGMRIVFSIRIGLLCKSICICIGVFGRSLFIFIYIGVFRMSHLIYIGVKKERHQYI